MTWVCYCDICETRVDKPNDTICELGNKKVLEIDLYDDDTRQELCASCRIKYLIDAVEILKKGEPNAEPR